MKKFFTLLLSLLVITVFAHEFWLQPHKSIYKKGDTAIINFRVGENFEGDNWAGNRDKINFLTLYTNGYVNDIANLIAGNKGDSLQLKLKFDGTTMVAYNGKNSFIELEAEKFNEYLKEDGLEDAYAYRKQHNEMNDSSHEYYQRSVKTILQVGNKYDATYKMKTELPVDIILQRHPYQLKKDEPMTANILFNKKPLANALVNLWHRENNKTVRTILQSDKNGMISFPVIRSGKWMVSTVKMIRLNNKPRAEWQSYWGSCTWGYQ